MENKQDVELYSLFLNEITSAAKALKNARRITIAEALDLLNKIEQRSSQMKDLILNGE